MLSEEKEPFKEQGCCVWTCSWALLGWLLEAELQLEWAEPSDSSELLAGELDELAAVSPVKKQNQNKTYESDWISTSYTTTFLFFYKTDAT